LRRVFGIAKAEMGEDGGGRVSGSRGIFDFAGGVGVVGRNDVLIFRGGIIRTWKDVK
jgi:hypothetical protein